MIPRPLRTLSVVAAMLLGLAAAAHAQAPYEVLHYFSGTDGASSLANLVQGRDGLFYGVTQAGGIDNNGTIFRIAADGRKFERLYTFTGAPDGSQPAFGGLVQDQDGCFYGTTWKGGLSDLGTVFKLDVSGPTPALTVLHSFAPGEGAVPDGSVMLGSDNVLYGTTALGGSAGDGTVFTLARDGTGFTTLHEFQGPDGVLPTADLIEADDGFLYGTTTGTSNGAGSIFRIAKDGTGFLTLHEFVGIGMGSIGRVIEGKDGNLYGTTAETGIGNPPAGTIFTLAKDGTGFVTLHSFTSSDPGFAPYGALLQAGDGNFYGTTSASPTGSGTYCALTGCGTVFRMTPEGTFATLHVFKLADGGWPQSSLVQGSNGDLFGTASTGGTTPTTSGAGVVFVLHGPGAIPIELTGTPFAYEGGIAAYSFSLNNTTGVDLPGPLVVDISISPGLALSAESSDAWLCAVQGVGYRCTWPANLPFGASTEPHTMHFDVGTPPYAPACGLGPSPCATFGATLATSGASALVSTAIATLGVGGVPNQLPYAGDDTANVIGTGPVTINVLANDGDPDGVTVTVTGIDVPPTQGDVIVNPDGTITYTPRGLIVGIDSFRYRVADSDGASVGALVTITRGAPTLTLSAKVMDIGPVPVGRLAEGLLYLDGAIGLPYTMSVEAVLPGEIPAILAGTGYDVAKAVSDPASFRGQDMNCGTFSPSCNVFGYFRPTAAPGQVSVARLVISVVVPDLAAPATISLAVVGVSVDPSAARVTAGDDSATTTINTAVEIPVLANDSSLAGRMLHVTSIWAEGDLAGFLFDGGGLPSQGTIGWNADATRLIYTPPPGFVGTTYFSYGISEDWCVDPAPCRYDGNYYFATVTVTVSGTAPGTPPNLIAQKFVLDQLGQAGGSLSAHNGDTIVFRLKTTNQPGPGAPPVGPTTGLITLTDVLPAGLTFVVPGSDARCGAAGQLVSCTDPGPLATGQAVIFEFHALDRRERRGCGTTDHPRQHRRGVDAERCQPIGQYLLGRHGDGDRPAGWSNGDEDRRGQWHRHVGPGRDRLRRDVQRELRRWQRCHAHGDACGGVHVHRMGRSGMQGCRVVHGAPDSSDHRGCRVCPSAESARDAGWTAGGGAQRGHDERARDGDERGRARGPGGGSHGRSDSLQCAGTRKPDVVAVPRPEMELYLGELWHDGVR